MGGIMEGTGAPEGGHRRRRTVIVRRGNGNGIGIWMRKGRRDAIEAVQRHKPCLFYDSSHQSAAASRLVPTLLLPTRAEPAMMTIFLDGME